MSSDSLSSSQRISDRKVAIDAFVEIFLAKLRSKDLTLLGFLETPSTSDISIFITASNESFWKFSFCAFACKNLTLSVEYFLLQKNNRLYYTDPVVKYGYCNGEHAVSYVQKVLDQYEKYRHIAP